MTGGSQSFALVNQVLSPPWRTVRVRARFTALEFMEGTEMEKLEESLISGPPTAVFICNNTSELTSDVHPVPDEIDREIAHFSRRQII